jgi:Glycosyl transferase family 2
MYPSTQQGTNAPEQSTRPDRERLTACLIVQNEQQRLPAALASVAFCDEVIVVDGGSTDRTLEIARAAGAKVIEHRWPGFAAQRNVALDAASGDWVLEIDADERVSPRLRASIEALLAAPPFEAGMAMLPLRHRFLGGLLGPSAKYPTLRSRLFRRKRYRHDEARAVHEGIEPLERPVVLDGDLEHELADTLREALLDTWSYARLEATHCQPPSTPRGYLFGIVLRPLAKVFYRVLVDAGWRDGWRGLLNISLDVGSDALVWMLVLVRTVQAGAAAGTCAGDAPTDDRVADSATAHFGRIRMGPPKVVVVAARGRAAQQATDWLAQLGAHGVDVALVTDQTDPSVVPWQRVAKLRPLAVMHALDVEMQMRTLDAVLPMGWRARLLWRVLPWTLRPGILGLSVGLDAERAAELVRVAVGED